METRDACLSALALAVRALRLGRQAEAGERVVEMVDALTRHLSRPPVRREGEIGPLLSRVVAAQERGDLLCIADLLEYEVGPRI